MTPVATPLAHRRNALTPQQREVMVLVANGFSIPEMAMLLHISPDSVNDRLRGAYRFLGVHERAHAVGMAMKRGLIRPQDINDPVVQEKS